MQLLTTSRLRTYRKCARMERLAYVERWRPVREGEALHFGTLVHLGLEAWTRVRMDGRPEEALASALAAVAGRAWGPEIQVKVEVLLEGYERRWSGDTDEILGVEEEFVVPLVNPQTWRESRTWRFAGKVDARLRRDGAVLIREHKTSSESIEDPGDPYWAKLAMDHQVSAYFLGAEALAAGDAPLSPRGCEYDVLKKPMHRLKLATPEADRKYTQPKIDKKTGEVIEPARLYATQRETDETAEEFRVRIREEVLGQLERYFVRKTIPRTESQLAEFMEDAWDQALTMRQGHLLRRAPRNPEACHAFGACPYWLLCSHGGADPAGYPGEYVRAGIAHPELSEDLQKEFDHGDDENGSADV